MQSPRKKKKKKELGVVAIHHQQIYRQFHGRGLQLEHFRGWVPGKVSTFIETVILQVSRLAPPFDENDAFNSLNGQLFGGLSKIFLGGGLVSSLSVSSSLVPLGGNEVELSIVRE